MYICPGKHLALFFRALSALKPIWISSQKPEKNVWHSSSCKVRYRLEYVKCKFLITSQNTLIVIFEKDLRAPTPGQVIVFYDEPNQICLGSAIIDIIGPSLNELPSNLSEEQIIDAQKKFFQVD